MKHGGAGSSYTNAGCRCVECTAANTARVQRRRDERCAETKDPEDDRHGKPSFYTNYGCRCGKCKAAYKTENKRIYDQRKAMSA